MRNTALLIALLTLGLAGSAHAQTRSRCPERPDHLILAMLAVHEAGWRSDADMRGIHAVLTTLSDRWGVSYAEAACRHSRRLLTGRTTRVWVSELTEDPTVAPAHWPTTVLVREGDRLRMAEHPSWASYSERWAGRLALARRVMEERPVTRHALTWGGRLDFSERRRRPLSGDRVWVEVDVGDTSNHFGYWTEAEEVSEAEVAAEADRLVEVD